MSQYWSQYLRSALGADFEREQAEIHRRRFRTLLEIGEAFDDLLRAAKAAAQEIEDSLELQPGDSESLPALKDAIEKAEKLFG